MKIYKDDSATYISQIINLPQKEFKKISLKDRKNCHIIANFMAKNRSGKDFIDVPCEDNFKNRISIITNPTLTKGKGFKKQLNSLKKGIMNILHLRISSARLFKEVASYKKNFFLNYWDFYLKDHCEIKSNCELDRAQVYLLADTHSDLDQILLRQHIIEHYMGDSDDCIILYEGVDLPDFKLINGKPFKSESWEVKEHYEESLSMAQTMAKMSKEINDLKMHWQEMRLNKTDELMLKNLASKVKKLSLDYKVNLQKLYEMKCQRDTDLQEKIKKAKETHNKVFVIAGRGHLIEEKYNILDNLESKYALFLPKITERNEINKLKFQQNLVNFGNYHDAYENL